MPYKLEVAEMFWESLDELESAVGNPEVLGLIVDELARRAYRDPLQAPPGRGDIRLLKTPNARITSIAISVRLAYYFDPAAQPSGETGRVILLHVTKYDELAEVMEDQGLTPEN